MSATVFVHFGDRGFWMYDIVLGMFLKYLSTAIVFLSENTDTDIRQAALRINTRWLVGFEDARYRLAVPNS